MIRKIRNLTAGTLLVAGIVSCQSAGNQKRVTVADNGRTPETEHLLNNLRVIPRQGVMFGHHDDPLYGIGWEGEEGRSDVKSSKFAATKIRDRKFILKRPSEANKYLCILSQGNIRLITFVV